MATTARKDSAIETTRAKSAPRVLSRPSRRASQAPHPVRWSKERYYRMAKLGWFDGKRVELIEGEIIEMAPIGTEHVTSVSLVQDVLQDIFGEGFYIRTQSPLSVSESSEPEPDVAVVQGSIRDYAQHHPTTALLVVEISDTTLQFDRTTKAALYARANIAEYWIVNLKARQLEVRREPQNGKYVKVETLTEKQSVAPLATPKKKIKVADLLP